jgi:hypothetical protein
MATTWRLDSATNSTPKQCNIYNDTHSKLGTCNPKPFAMEHCAPRAYFSTTSIESLIEQPRWWEMNHALKELELSVASHHQYGQSHETGNSAKCPVPPNIVISWQKRMCFLIDFFH